ncbi:MAG: PucR family transcriptional regulator [Solirubrobacterales bacterium]|nr:PucR family transcriptional regulator [Solirubrobacterales bacterium]
MPIDAASREVLRGLVERIELDEYAARVQRALEEMPEYQGFVDGRVDRDDRGPAGIRWNVEAFLRWAADGGEPAPEALDRLREMAGARAAEGRPPEEGLAVYRRAMRAGWEAVLEAADDRERAALGGAFDSALEWLDIVAEVFERAYAEQRDALVSPDERRARTLLERLAAGAAPGPDDRRLAEALGFALADSYAPLAAAVPGASAIEHLRVAAQLRARGLLAVAEGSRVVALAPAPGGRDSVGGSVGGDGVAGGGPRTAVPPGRSGGQASAAPAAADHRPDPAVAAARDDERLVAAALDPTPPAAVADALADLRAVVALATAAGERGAVDPDRWLAELLLFRSPRLARRLERRIYGPLLRAGRPDLADTLDALAAAGFERAAAAAALSLHRNTLAQRAARIESLAGLDLADTADRARIWLAARVRAGLPLG